MELWKSTDLLSILREFSFIFLILNLMTEEEIVTPEVTETVEEVVTEEVTPELTAEDVAAE